LRYVAERDKREVIPTKAPRTQSDNGKELEQLYKFFDDPPAPLERIEPRVLVPRLARPHRPRAREPREGAIQPYLELAREGLHGQGEPVRRREGLQ
jgi:hypothetical protein